AVGVIMGACKGILVTRNIYLFQEMIDAAVAGIYEQAVRRLIWIAGFMGLIVLAEFIKNRAQLSLNTRIDMVEGETLLNKCNSLPYELFESNGLYPRLDHVMKEGVNQKKEFTRCIFSAVEFATEFIGLNIYAGSVRWWCVLAVILLTIPVWLLTIIGASSEGKYIQENWKWNQRANLFSHILNSREYIKEEKVFGFYPLISKKWKENADKYQQGKIRSTLSVRVWIGGINFLQYAFTILMAWLLIREVRKGNITAGELMATMDSLWRMIGSALFTVVGLLGGFVGYGQFNRQRKWFMELNEEKDDGEELKAIRSLEFRNVSYAYPPEKDDKPIYVLKDVSFYINHGEKVALVGENGSGKSTVIKLMTGLLEPTEGHIYINGQEAGTYSLSSRRKAFSGVFQDYMKYELSLEDNIRLGALWLEEKPQKALNSIDSELEASIGGMKQVLGRSVKGARDISGGQWQKIALSRGLYSDADFLILDEPTAAIDPISEREIIETMLTERDDCTKVVVTHRLGAVRKMDRVIVLRDGTIENIGRHDDLRKEDAYYEKLYSTQEQWYLA
ncbi:MAG: ABC transporter ATP-binding protein, partial [Lachnospiraceae bacterium]|nr:ABC transporter ATP-binding protein [Lachnospiraceae bacterium]